MLDDDIDDTHYCIKCTTTIVGLENYVQHRKNSNCTGKTSRDIPQDDHTYGAFDFNESSGFHKSAEEVEKTGKSLSESYDLPYGLGADVFFSSLELQSSSKRGPIHSGSTQTNATPSGGSAPSTIGGKLLSSTVITRSSQTTGSTNNSNIVVNTTTSNVIMSSNTTSNTTVSGSGSTANLNRIMTRKATAAALISAQENEDEWMNDSGNNSDNLMKAVRDISGNKKCDSVFKLIPFQHDSPEPSEEEEDDDEDYDNVVPSHHTGGKWKPENRPILRPILLRNSPAWDERNQWDITENSNDKSMKIQEHEDFEHDLNPPPGHTKGKWIPGTKVIKLDYKEEVEIEKIYRDQYWCNTCNRKLSSKVLYERHLKSNLHIKRSEPEQELEQATVKATMISERIKKPSIYLNESIYLTVNKSQSTTDKTVNPNQQQLATISNKKRKRRSLYVKCETCKTRLPKYLLGKHLISHYHYRRMILNPSRSSDMILQNMLRIVQQAPYQCQPCRFYTNTEDNFLLHWNSREHLDCIEGPGNFFCNFCKFECEDNNQMRRHLLGSEHKEVILAINRSVPIIIGKKANIECSKCKQNFRYNIQLYKHSYECTSEPVGTASNEYQSKFECKLCSFVCKSKISLQRHKMKKHKMKRYYCTPCKIEFSSSEEALKHRSSMEHKITTKTLKKGKQSVIKVCKKCGQHCQNLIKLKEHVNSKHPEEKSSCPFCGKTFTLPQEVGRHVRDKICQKPSINLEIQEENITKTDVLNSLPLKEDQELHVEQAKEEIPSPPTFAEEFQETDLPALTENTVEKCRKCEFVTNLKSELIFHEILHEHKGSGSRIKLPCPLCEREFRKHSLRCHLRQHTNERVFECTECEMKFTRKHNLKTHIENIHQEKKSMQENPTHSNNKVEKDVKKIFTCKICEKVFAKKYSLQQHSHVHGERDKKFSCPMDMCIFIGRSSSHLQEHLMVHSTEKTYKCDFEGCEYRGKTVSLLRRHSKVHQADSKEFQCPRCFFKSKVSGHLKRHMRIHTGEKPYKCPYCEYTCNNLENLRKHVITTLIHPGRNLYECKYCNAEPFFKTNLQKEFRAHLTLTHQIKVMNINDIFSFAKDR